MSYASSLANSHNQMRRDLMRSPFYRSLFPSMELKDDKNRISEFANNYRGEMFARGLDSAITGIGASADGGIIVDDGNNPVKSESDRVRLEELRKFKDYSVGRKSDPKKTPIIVIQQRTQYFSVKL